MFHINALEASGILHESRERGYEVRAWLPPDGRLGASSEPRRKTASVQSRFGALLELARGLLVETRQHQALVPVSLGLRLCSRIQDELRNLAKALRLLLFHGIPPPLPRA